MRMVKEGFKGLTEASFRRRVLPTPDGQLIVSTAHGLDFKSEEDIDMSHTLTESQKVEAIRVYETFVPMECQKMLADYLTKEAHAMLGKHKPLSEAEFETIKKNIPSNIEKVLKHLPHKSKSLNKTMRSVNKVMHMNVPHRMVSHVRGGTRRHRMKGGDRKWYKLLCHFLTTMVILLSVTGSAYVGMFLFGDSIERMYSSHFAPCATMQDQVVSFVFSYIDPSSSCASRQQRIDTARQTLMVTGGVLLLTTYSRIKKLYIAIFNYFAGIFAVEPIVHRRGRDNSDSDSDSDEE